MKNLSDGFKDALVTKFSLSNRSSYQETHDTYQLAVKGEEGLEKNKQYLAQSLAQNLKNFIKMHEAKQRKLQSLEQEYQETLAENYEKKKTLVKKNVDLQQLERGIYVEEESPMAKFLREMNEERERIAQLEALRKEEEAREQKKRDMELAEKLRLEEEAKKAEELEAQRLRDIEAEKRRLEEEAKERERARLQKIEDDKRRAEEERIEKLKLPSETELEEQKIFEQLQRKLYLSSEEQQAIVEE